MKAEITTEVSPIVGSERQSEDLVNYLLGSLKKTPRQDLGIQHIRHFFVYACNEDCTNKAVPPCRPTPRIKLKETVDRIINEGCSGLICMIV